MNKPNTVPLVKGGQGRDAESLLADARVITILSAAALVGALLGVLL